MSNWVQKMNEEEAQAEIEYLEIMKKDKGKTFLEIMPPEFTNFKRSIVKRNILESIETTLEVLNTCSIYDGRVFDRKEIVRYMMRGTDYHKFYLAHKFIPKKSDMSLWMGYCAKHKEENEGKLPEYAAFAEENKELLSEYRNVEWKLQGLKQCWEQYEERVAIQNGTYKADYEKDGYPRTGRGNLCVAFIPVKGYFPKNKTGHFEVMHIRSKKIINYEIIGYKKEDRIYMCLNVKKEKVFLIEFDHVNDGWDALCDTNKETFSGWWNRVVESKEES